MSDFKYPHWYTPMTDGDLEYVWYETHGKYVDRLRAIEQAVLSRLPQDAAERSALAKRIDDFETWDSSVADLLSDIRAYLTGGEA